MDVRRICGTPRGVTGCKAPDVLGARTDQPWVADGEGIDTVERNERPRIVRMDESRDRVRRTNAQQEHEGTQRDCITRLEQHQRPPTSPVAPPSAPAVLSWSSE